MAVHVLLVEDHALVREGLKTLLESKGFKVVAEASDGQQALRLAREIKVDIAVLDIGMPLLNGIDAARELQKSSLKIKTILLTRHEEESFIAAALAAGVKGYVLKSQVASDLVLAIQRVYRGGTYLSPGISQAVVEAYLSKGTQPTDVLTPRERQVLQLIGEGKSTKQIAGVLGIGAKTAETHRSRLMQKLDIHEIASLVRYGVRCGLVQP
jgi:DNA-binding NarL/FixJ family response regulator